MVTLIVFWAAVFAIICFVLGSFFKAMASAFGALISSLAVLISYAFLSGAAMLVLQLIYEIVDRMIQGRLGDVISTIVITVIVLGIIGAIFGGFFSIVKEFVEWVFSVVTFVLDLVNTVLNKAVDLFERGYIKSLKTITKQMEK